MSVAWTDDDKRGWLNCVGCGHLGRCRKMFARPYCPLCISDGIPFEDQRRVNDPEAN